MSNIIIMNKPYTDEYAIDTLVNYCANPEKCIGSYACGVNFDTTKTVIDGMKFMRKFLGKPEGKQLCHFIVTIDSSYYTREKSKYICVQVAKDLCMFLYKYGYQSFSAIHNNTKCVHAHFIVNTINIRTGKLMPNASELMYKYHRKLQNTRPELDMKGVMYNKAWNTQLDDIER